MSILKELDGMFTLEPRFAGPGPRNVDPIARRRATCLRKLKASYENAQAGIEPKKNSFPFVIKKSDGSFRVRLYVNSKALTDWKQAHSVGADRIDEYLNKLTSFIESGKLDDQLQEAEELNKKGKIKKA